MSNDFPISFTGSLGRDPEIKYLASGVTVAEFSVAGRERRKVNGQYEDADASWIDCKAFGQLAENIAETFSKGTRVTGSGTLRQEKWETDGGDKRSKHVIVVDNIGPDLRFASAKVTRNESGGSSGGGQRQQASSAPENPYA